MISESWHRPDSVEYPRVWRKFERTTQDGSKTAFEIRDVTEDMIQDITEFIVTYYLNEEPWNLSCGIPQDPESVEVLFEYAKEMVFKKRTALVCLKENAWKRDGKYEVVSCNMVGVALKKEPEDFSRMAVTEPIIKLLSIYGELKSASPDVYEKYGSESYMASVGLAVHPRYRKLGIATEMLLARIAMCKEFGIGLSTTVFTSGTSQRAAERAGFVTDAAVPYDQLSQKTGVTFHNRDAEARLMSIVIQ